ncbi:MAG: type II toxin-antitoxin system Phd/YefM family antitoxin [Thermocrispum sp.]
MEEAVGIRELRQHASKVMARVKAGERVAVTERGKLVAYLVPAERAGSMIERLEAAGQYHRGKGSLLDLGPPPPAPDGGPPLSEVLAQLRDEERY